MKSRNIIQRTRRIESLKNENIRNKCLTQLKKWGKYLSRTSYRADNSRYQITNMAVAIRLSRQGAKDRPYYKIVVVDSRARRDGRFIEQVGTYNPLLEGVNYTLDLEKVTKWLGTGARPSVTVNSIIKKVKAAQ